MVEYIVLYLINKQSLASPSGGGARRAEREYGDWPSQPRKLGSSPRGGAKVCCVNEINAPFSIKASTHSVVLWLNSRTITAPARADRVPKSSMAETPSRSRIRPAITAPTTLPRVMETV